MSDTRPKGPFSDILVVDLTRVLAGPYCALLMAELGARVIKIEPPRRRRFPHDRPLHEIEIGQDEVRLFPLDQSRQGIHCARSEGEADRKIFDALLARADVLIENYRGGTMEKLGFGWERAARYPRFDLCRHLRFRSHGALRTTPRLRHGRAGHGRHHEPDGTSRRSADAPGFVHGPPTGGLFALMEISPRFTSAENGKGMKVDVSMLDCQVAILEYAIARISRRTISRPARLRHPSIAPFAAFATKTATSSSPPARTGCLRA